MKTLNKLICLTAIAAVAGNIAVMPALAEDGDGTQEVTQFMDCFEPAPLRGGLSDTCWGAADVGGARDQNNGLEDKLIGTDAEGERYIYWDGAIMKDDDSDKYYMFASRWKESDGHDGWHWSKAVYATSDNLYGPYEDQGLVYPDIGSGDGHNVFPFRLHENETYNGKPIKYGIVLGDTANGNLRSGILVSDSLEGPWDFIGQMNITGDGFNRSNIGIVARPEGGYLAYTRDGDIAVTTEEGIENNNWEVVVDNLWDKTPFLAGYTDVEDPVMWYSNDLYHCVVNRWDARRAYYMTSENGIDDWKIYKGTAYIPGGDYIQYVDEEGNVTVNRWHKLERPNVYIEDGEVKAFTLAVINVAKENEKGSDANGSKVIVLGFNNDKLKALDANEGAALNRSGMKAVADMNVQSWGSEGTQNYGSVGYMRVANEATQKGLFGETQTAGSGDTKIGYIRFDFSDYDISKIEKAELSLMYYNRWNSTDTINEGQLICALADDNWEETQVTFATKPAVNYDPNDEDTFVYSDVFPTDEGMYEVRVDVTKLIKSLPQGTTTATIAFNSTNNDQDIAFASNEYRADNNVYGPILNIQGGEQSEIPIDQPMAISSINKSEDKITVQLGGVLENGCLYIALYNKDGVLTGIKSYVVTPDGTNVFEKPIEDEDISHVSTYLWKDNMKPFDMKSLENE